MGIQKAESDRQTELNVRKLKSWSTLLAEAKGGFEQGELGFIGASEGSGNSYLKMAVESAVHYQMQDAEGLLLTVMSAGVSVDMIRIQLGKVMLVHDEIQVLQSAISFDGGYTWTA